MQREIKFRAWDKDSSTMIYCKDSIRNDLGEFYFDFDGRLVLMLSDGDCERPPEIRDAEITQFTGILDKNGKEIYEGDILEQINFNGEEYLARYEVVFDENYCLKMILGNEKAMQLEGLSAFGNAIKGKLIKGKIIGNIWESPALIGGENGK